MNRAFIRSVFSAVLLLAASREPLAAAADPRDWRQFSSTTTAALSTVSVQNVDRLRRVWRTPTPEPVDGSPLFVHSISTPSGILDLVIVATQSGRVLALDAASGRPVWTVPPPTGPRWTTSSPALDPNGKYFYAYGLDGYVHKREVSTGNEVTAGGWPEQITRKPDVEKGSSAISIATSKSGSVHLYMTVAGYPDPGDAGDYQGHLVTIDLRTGAKHIFNAACSDKEMLFAESGSSADDCANVQSGIWARAGAVYEPRTDRVYVTTGNGVYDGDRGGFNWANSVVALASDGSPNAGVPMDTFTPTDYQFLTDADLDLSSTNVAALVLPSGSPLPPLAVQGGKDGRLRLLNLANLSGQGGPGHLGGEYQIVDLPQWGEISTRPAVWLEGKTSHVVVANGQGVTAFTLSAPVKGSPVLVRSWNVPKGSSSPLYAKGVLFCVRSHELFALDAARGKLLWSDTDVDLVHWQTPIVVGSSLFVADARGVNAYTIPVGGTPIPNTIGTGSGIHHN